MIRLAAEAGRHLNLTKPGQANRPTAYVDFWQAEDLEGYSVLLIKTRSPMLDLGAILRIINEQGLEYIERFGTLRSQIDQALIANRLLAYLAGAFSLLAFVMAAAGLFGLLNYQVANRTGGIGIRIALGANRRHIQSLVLSHVMGLLLVGSLAGLALTFALQKADGEPLLRYF